MRDLLIRSQRVTGGRKSITVIDPSRIDEFFNRLKDSDIPIHIKTFIAISLSGGLRVSEALTLRPADFSDDIGKIRVLKKKAEVYREFRLHPIAANLLEEYKKRKGINHFGYLFKFTRNHAYKQVKKIFGEGTSPHAIARHSHISFLIHSKGLHPMKVARLMEVGIHVVASYNHLNTVKELKTLW